MLASTMMLKAYEEGGPAVGFVTSVTSVSFFLAFILARLDRERF